MSKRVDINKDTIQSVRERNNKRFSFHQTLNFLSRHLVEMAQKEVIDSSSSGATRSITSFEQQDAARYKPNFAKKRFKVDHSILGALGATGASPYGRGKRKNCLETHNNYREYKRRADNCTGCPVRFFKPAGSEVGGKPSGFKIGERRCDLCNTRATSWVCSGCKQILCVDKDRSKVILDQLKDPDIGPMLRRRFPALSDLSRGDVPAFYTDIGQINGKQIFAGMSCF